MSTDILKAHPGIGEPVEGLALVAADNFSARYDLDRVVGTFSRRAHKLYGRNYVGRILVLNAAKGGVASAWMLKEMVDRGKAPAALLLNFANPIMAQGAAFGGLPLLDRFEGDVTCLIPDGARVRVDPATGTVQLLDKQSNQ